MRRLVLIMAALGVFAVFSANPVTAEAGHRYRYNYGRTVLHYHQHNNAYDRWLSHRNVNRYPVSYWGHSRFQGHQHHDAYQDRLIHRAAYRSYQPSYGLRFSGYRGGSSYGVYRSGHSHGRRGFSIRFGR